MPTTLNRGGAHWAHKSSAGVDFWWKSAIAKTWRVRVLADTQRFEVDKQSIEQNTEYVCESSQVTLTSAEKLSRKKPHLLALQRHLRRRG